MDKRRQFVISVLFVQAVYPAKLVFLPAGQTLHSLFSLLFIPQLGWTQILLIKPWIDYSATDASNESGWPLSPSLSDLPRVEGSGLTVSGKLLG